MKSRKKFAPASCEALTGEKLGNQIRQVCQGANAVLAVAYWGRGAFEMLKLNRKDVRIVLDISAGGTNPTEFDTMKSSLRESLHVLDHLHAKLYTSDAGAVITSANASDNGLNLKGAGLAEAGVYFPGGTTEAKAIRDMAEAFYIAGRDANKADLKRCRELWAKLPRSDDGLNKAGSPEVSFVKALKDQPELFAQYRFIVTNASLRHKEIQEAWDPGRTSIQEPGETLPRDFDCKQWTAFNWQLEDELLGKECIHLHMTGRKKIRAAIVIPRPPAGGWTFAKFTSWKGRGFNLTAGGYCTGFEDGALARAIKELSKGKLSGEVWRIHDVLKRN